MDSSQRSADRISLLERLLSVQLSPVGQPESRARVTVRPELAAKIRESAVSCDAQAWEDALSYSINEVGRIIVVKCLFCCLFVSSSRAYDETCRLDFSGWFVRGTYNVINSLEFTRCMHILSRCHSYMYLD